MVTTYSSMSPVGNGTYNSAQLIKDVATRKQITIKAGTYKLNPTLLSNYTTNQNPTINLVFEGGAKIIPATAGPEPLLSAYKGSWNLVSPVFEMHSAREICIAADNADSFTATDFDIKDLGCRLENIGIKGGTYALKLNYCKKVRVTGFKTRNLFATGNNVITGTAPGVVRCAYLLACDDVIFTNIDIDGVNAEEADLFHIQEPTRALAAQGTVVIDGGHIVADELMRRCVKVQGGRVTVRNLNITKKIGFVPYDSATDCGSRNFNCLDFAGKEDGYLRAESCTIDASAFVYGISHSAAGPADVTVTNVTMTGSTKPVHTIFYPPSANQQNGALYNIGGTGSVCSLTGSVPIGFARTYVGAWTHP